MFTSIVPPIDSIVIFFLCVLGLRREGIYRVSGRHAQIMNLKKQFETNEEAVDLTDAAYADDCASIAAVLKNYLRELPEPLFPFPHSERVAYSGKDTFFSGLIASP
jgi:hypothetical protein